MNWYNGYSPQERARKLRASYKLFPNRSHPHYRGPCQLCGDPDHAVEPHSEDYSEPYMWDNPAEYAVCKPCHSRLHKRFNEQSAWAAYKSHLRRGGYGSDLKTPAIRREVANLACAFALGNAGSLTPLPRQITRTGQEWWETLSTDPASLTNRSARPRP